MPERIQRKRTAGWRMPSGAIYVGRPTRLGNPWKVGTTAHITVATGPAAAWRAWPVTITPAIAVELYRELWRRRLTPPGPDALSADIEYWQRDVEAIEALRGRDLVDWCPLDQPCHADVLLEICAEGGPDASHP